MPRVPSQIVSTVPTGTSPLSVASTTMVTNLNANYLQGYTAASFATASHGHSAAEITSGTFAVARLGTGTPNATRFVDGSGAWRNLTTVDVTDMTDFGGTLAQAIDPSAGRAVLEAAASTHVHIIADTTGLQAALDSKISATRQVATQHSLTGGGSLALDRTLSLVNDSASPGTSKYYGTDSGGTKGYHTLPSSSGGNVRATTKVSTSYTASTSDSIIIAGESASNYTIILPTSGVTNGQMFTVVRPGSGGAGYPSVDAYPVTEDLSAPGDSRTWVWYSSDAQYYLINTIPAS